MLKSYRRERMSELRDGIRDRNEKAGEFIEKRCKAATPEQTETLKNSIESYATGETIDVGFTAPKYGLYVHNGTIDFNHKRETWGEEGVAEFEAWKSAQDRRGGSTEITPPKGLMPRPFLLVGIVQAKPRLRTFYPPIN